MLIVGQKIEHAGYHRDVISRNPHRYDDDGEKLDEDDDDEAADIAAAEVDPYHGILLHGTNATSIPSLQLLITP